MGVFDKIFQGDEPDKEVNAILARGKRLLNNHFYDWAAVEFNKALDLDPKLASVTITQLYQEMQGGGNPDGMISLGANVLQQDPKNVELANILGNAYRKKNDWNHAKNMYQHCLKYDPNFQHAAYNLAATMAKVELADGNAVSAIAEFEDLSGFVLPDNEEGLEKLHEMQQYFEDEEEATEEQATPETDEVSEGEKSEEEKEAEKAKAEEEKKAKALEAKMSEVKADNAKEEGEDDDEIRIDPLRTFKYITSNLEAESKEETDACLALGIYCLQQREGYIAQRALERLLMRDKTNVNLRCFLVLALSLKGAMDKAVKTLQGILGRNPNHRYSNVNLGYLYKRTGKKLQARVCFFTTQKLLERSQGHYDIQTCLDEAEKHFTEGKGKKALEVYEPLTSEINSDELMSRIATLYLEEKFWDEALALFKRILRKNRQNSEARQGLKKIHEAYLMEMENLLKKQEASGAAAMLDKALGIAPSKALIQKGVTLHRVLENENRAMELERMLNKINSKELSGKVQEKISLAEEAETKGNFKGAIRYYEEAIRIDPRHSTLKKMIDLCNRIKRPDLAEKLTNWFNKYEENLHEKEKAQAREAFKQDAGHEAGEVQTDEA